jgi:hypothetical protein
MAMANMRESPSKGVPSAKAFFKAIVRVAEQTCAENETV